MIESNRKTQKERLLELLKGRKSYGVPIYEIFTPRPDGLGIAQYGARIYELRREGYDIRNKDGKFVLYTEPVQTSFI